MIKLIFILFACNISIAQETSIAPGVLNQDGIPVQGMDPATETFQATAPVGDLKLEFNYNENEGRDPFKPYKDPNIVVLENKLSDNNVTQDEKPLVRNIKTIAVPADVILLGVVYNKENPVAAIKVIDGKTYYMKKKDTIGRHDGKIIDITRNTVVIQQIKEFDGQKNIEKVILKFKKNEQN